MAKYSLEIKPSAGKELDVLDNALFARTDRKILMLAENLRPPGCQKLRGYKDQRRIRVGAWRILYIIDDDATKMGKTRGSPVVRVPTEIAIATTQETCKHWVQRGNAKRRIA